MEPTPGIPAFDPDRCASYLDGTLGSPPREQLLIALKLGSFAPNSSALDVGCGPGKEVVELLRAGFDVTAIDPYPSMIELTKSRVREECPELLGRLTLACARLEDRCSELAPGAFAIVHAGFVLPFVQEADFPAAVASLLTSVAPGGLFVGQFFGPDDEFVRESPSGSMTCHDAEAVRRLLARFEIVLHQEVNRSGSIGKGRAKWWHVHHIVARRLP